ncbi:MAG: zinc ribbon domain-containing protein [Bacteroidota bacterium]|nr:zinc ribbon domain-containing protein [Bacteroidota bacterium]
MPTYEYHCLNCDKIFTLQLSFEEYEKKKTPDCIYCQSKNVKQILSGVSVVTSKKS